MTSLTNSQIDTLGTILIVLVLAIVVSIVIRGFLVLIDRYNFILVILYFAIVFPIAFIHSFFVGIFGKFKEKVQ